MGFIKCETYNAHTSLSLVDLYCFDIQLNLSIVQIYSSLVWSVFRVDIVSNQSNYYFMSKKCSSKVREWFSSVMVYGNRDSFCSCGVN